MFTFSILKYSSLHFDNYKREGKELTGKYGTTIGAPNDFKLLSPFLEDCPFSFRLPESSDTRDDTNSRKQLKTAEKKTIGLDFGVLPFTSFFSC
ncbi:hypothetical protein Vadar_024288 [Vaccinium darrowii]|uniref:Uncharacterized protein n=1 Tax=Vaccinium darrowii TaxID=229202 RepID=A0ACB7ZDD5_9ERIC|nr:hypothetical protein Vadar_024288 [Vaccinium darrowii]